MVMSADRLSLLQRLLLIATLACSPVFAEPDTVRVGIYPYSPYAEQSDDGHYSGLTPDLLQLLNQHQQQYRFVTVPISPKRRYQAFARQDYDMIFFENPDWGWQGIPLQASKPYRTDGEVYVAMADEGRDQHYFDTLKGKRMIGILGFHYGFAGFNADEQYLREHYHMILSWTNEKNLSLLRERYGDVAIMSEAFLRRYLSQHPKERKDFLISERYDQRYKHSVLIRPGFSPDAAVIDRLLNELCRNGELQALFRRYDVTGAGTDQESCPQ